MSAVDLNRASNPTVELGETLKVVNVGPVDLNLRWNSRQYYAAANGGETYMPFDGVKLYFGDPRASAVMQTLKDTIGIVEFLSDRATEVRRLRLLYAAPFGEYLPDAADAGSIFARKPQGVFYPGENRAFQGMMIPHVEVYNIAGDRIYTVLDDPEGMDTIPARATLKTQSDLQQVVLDQGRLITAMAERLGIDPQGNALLNHPNVTGETPPDLTQDDWGPSPDASDPDGTLTPSDPTAVVQENPPTVYNPSTGEMEVKGRRGSSKRPQSLSDLEPDRID